MPRIFWNKSKCTHHQSYCRLFPWLMTFIIFLSCPGLCLITKLVQINLYIAEYLHARIIIVLFGVFSFSWVFLWFRINLLLLLICAIIIFTFISILFLIIHFCIYFTLFIILSILLIINLIMYTNSLIQKYSIISLM